MSTSKPILVGIIDDHQIIIDGLQLLLGTDSSVTVPLTLTSASGLPQMPSDSLQVLDVLILDLNMPDWSGLQTAVWLATHHPDIRILVLTMNTDVGAAFDIVEQPNVFGFLPKSADKSELLEAVHRVASGKLYLHQHIAVLLEQGRPGAFVPEVMLLSESELEIVRCIAAGKQNKEIAAELFISENTVATHRKNILRKTACHNAAALVEWAGRSNLL